MTVRILKQFKRLKPGTQAELPDGMANVLIRRGFAAEVSQLETATRERRESAVMPAATKRKRGRPRKVR